jgi:hypothetical protein
LNFEGHKADWVSIYFGHESGQFFSFFSVLLIGFFNAKPLKNIGKYYGTNLTLAKQRSTSKLKEHHLYTALRAAISTDQKALAHRFLQEYCIYVQYLYFVQLTLRYGPFTQSKTDYQKGSLTTPCDLTRHII